MLTRREFFLYTAATLGTSFFSKTAFTQSPNRTFLIEDDFPPLPEHLVDAEGEDDFFSLQLDSIALGKADPGKDKKDKAKAIMDAAPKNCRPIDVANFYRGLGKGETEFGQEGRAYARGWPREYNPIIIEFFKTTSLNPLSQQFDGDATAWCAAFMNYCIARAMSKDGNIGKSELAKGTRSASSGSFRCFGKSLSEGEQPKEGDIAVWALEGTINGCRVGSGHVGFFVSMTGDTDRPYLIMGGNQKGDLLSGITTRSDGAFAKAMPEKYLGQNNPKKYKKFLTFRTASYL